MLPTIMKSNAIRVLAILALVAIPAFASPIYVNNFSFEDTVTGFSTCLGTNCLSGNLTIPSWTSSVPGQSGIFNVTGPNGYYWTGPPSDGVQSAYVYTRSSTAPVTLSQTVGATTVAGWVYTLTVDIGERLDTAASFAGTADLLINGVQHFVACPAPVRGSFVTCTTSYVATASNQAMSIELSANALQGNFDNVRLDAVPEPASFLLIGSALFVLSSLRRRRANS